MVDIIGSEDGDIFKDYFLHVGWKYIHSLIQTSVCDSSFPVFDLIFPSILRYTRILVSVSIEINI